MSELSRLDLHFGFGVGFGSITAPVAALGPILLAGLCGSGCRHLNLIPTD